MPQNVDPDHADHSDDSELLIQAEDKAARLLQQLLLEQSNLEPHSPGVDRINQQAMAKSRAALGETISAVQRTIESLRRVNMS